MTHKFKEDARIARLLTQRSVFSNFSYIALTTYIMSILLE
jgi:hypothetical protein